MRADRRLTALAALVTVVFRFTDPAITESSGLVVTDGLAVTTNDSGDEGRVFAVDPATGDTVGVTTWASDPVDVEALAPAGPGEVWVGDIGDNAGERPYVEVARVPVGRSVQGADPVRYRLVLPDGARDAEALLAHPRTGRLYLVTKTLLGGTVLAAPRRLAPDRDNVLRPVGGVVGPVTDGAFTADGRHVVLRTYSRAVVYRFPDLSAVGDFALPRQPQGEGLAIAPDGDLWLTSEGAGSDVLAVPIPPRVERAMADPRETDAAAETETDAAPEPEAAAPDSLREGAAPWIVAGLLGLMVLARRRRGLR